MASPGYIHKARMGHQIQKLPDMILTDQLGLPPAHKLDRTLKATTGSKKARLRFLMIAADRPGTVNEIRIPVPAQSAIFATAQVPCQSIQ